MTQDRDRSRSIEVMAPAGSHEALTAALQAGAHSVYFGVGRLNMRSRSTGNFIASELPEIASLCHKADCKAYLALNTVIYGHEIAEMKQLVDAATEAGIDAIIASDITVLEYARSKGATLHISTQCNITSTDAVRFYARYADVMVLARELTLAQVREICDDIRRDNICGPSGRPVRIEIFAHGALCMAVSGKCYLSLDNLDHSANRGECLQPCRRAYIVTDKESGMELEVDHEYIMSPKDLCTIHLLDQIIDAGVSLIKIEGRGRKGDYVRTVTTCYLEAVRAIADGSYTPERIEGWTARLREVYNRGFWEGYYLGRKLGEWSPTYGSQATRQKSYIGKVSNYYGKIGIAEVTLETGTLSEGEEVLIMGPTTGACQSKVGEIRLDEGRVPMVRKGDVCSFAVPETVRRQDKVYVVRDAIQQ